MLGQIEMIFIEDIDQPMLKRGKGIRIGPTPPAFISPNILKILQEKFDLKLITPPQISPPKNSYKSQQPALSFPPD